MPVKDLTFFGMGKGPRSGVCKGLTFEMRPSCSQPTTFVKARYVAPAPAALRNRRLVTLVSIVKLYTIEILLQLA